LLFAITVNPTTVNHAIAPRATNFWVKLLIGILSIATAIMWYVAVTLWLRAGADRSSPDHLYQFRDQSRRDNRLTIPGGRRAAAFRRPGRQLVPHPFYRENEQPRELAALGNSRIDLRQAVGARREEDVWRA
jgi:hypothetical protein